MLDYEKEFYSFYEQNTSNEEENQKIKIDYSGDFTSEQSIPLTNTYEQMKESKLFTVFEMYFQFIEWIDYEGLDKFGYGYEKGVFKDQGKNFVEDQIQVYETTRIKSTQLSLNFFDKYNLKVEEGEEFDEEDYIYSFGEIVPVILGYEYAGNYEVGEKFRAFYLFNQIEFEVIGFLAEDSYIKDWNSDLHYLDRDVVIPMFNIVNLPRDEEDGFFQTLHYSNKTSGLLECKKSTALGEISKELSNISERNELPAYNIYALGENGGMVNITVSTKQIYKALSIGKWIVFFICLVAFITLIRSQVKIHLKDYTVYSLFISYRKIMLSLILEISVLVLISIFFTSIIVIVVKGIFGDINTLFLFAGLLIIILSGYIYLEMQNVNFKKYLVEDEDDY